MLKYEKVDKKFYKACVKPYETVVDKDILYGEWIIPKNSSLKGMDMLHKNDGNKEDIQLVKN